MNDKKILKLFYILWGIRCNTGGDVLESSNSDGLI